MRRLLVAVALFGVVEAAPSTPVEAERQILALLQTCLHQPWRFAEATAACRLAATRAESIGRTDLEGFARAGLPAFGGWILSFDESIREGERALALLHDRQDRWEYRFALVGLGANYRERGDVARAFEYLHRAMALSVAKGDLGNEALGRAMLARTLFWVGDYEAARSEARQAIDLAHRAGHRHAEFMATWQLAMTELEAGRIEESIAAHQTAHQIALSYGNVGGATHMEINLADAHAQLGRSQEAERYLASVRGAIERGAAPNFWTPYADEIEARIRVVQQRYAPAAQLYGLAARQSSSSWLTVRALLGKARALQRTNAIEPALQAYDDVIREVERTRVTASADEQRAVYMAANGAAYRELVALLWQARGPAETVKALGVAERARARALLDALHAAGLGAGAEATPLAGAEVQARVPSGALFVEYVLAQGRLFAFAITRTSVRWIALDIDAGDPLAQRVELFRRLVQENDRPESLRAVGARLYRDLLAPVMEGAGSGIRSLVISPDGVLHALPFDALTIADGSETSFLAERYGVSYVPSASLLQQHTERRTASVPFLGIADPPTGPAFAGRALGTLPWSRTESEDAAARMRNAQQLVGSSLSEAAIRKLDLSRYRILHFATHGVIDHTLPLRSALWLGSDGEEDGFLRVAEIYRLDVAADLVVLSACETGSGRYLAGEGLQSLARAFLYAGARSVVATFWEVGDRHSAELMQDFYDSLSGGTGVAAALTEAKRQAIRRGAPPRAWAAFVLIGAPDVRAIEPTQLSMTTAIALLLVVAVFACAAFIWARGLRSAIAAAP